MNMSQIDLSFPLTCLRLRFTCQAETRLHLGGLRAGSNFRGALVNVMRRTTCTGDSSDPLHAASCPVCWLISANDHPGEERRGYVLSPPPGCSEALNANERFEFHITLFGNALQYLPYFILAVPEAGRLGVGIGRGQYSLLSIHAERPIKEDWEVLKEGEKLVRAPSEMISHKDILQASEICNGKIGRGQRQLRIEFLTPLRLILAERLLKSPDFGVFFNHLLKRLDDLSIQHSGGRERGPEERLQLWNLANQVRMVECQTEWQDLMSGSSRTGQKTWISGLVGTACYSAPTEIWQELMPWLLWGQITQVGKDTAKGNGVYRLKVD